MDGSKIRVDVKAFNVNPVKNMDAYIKNYQHLDEEMEIPQTKTAELLTYIEGSLGIAAHWISDKPGENS